MRTSRRGPLMLAVVVSLAVSRIAAADEAIVLRAGEATGPNLVFAVDAKAKPHVIVIRTSQVGVAGSRLEVSVDGAKEAAFSHIFATEECKFGDGGSKCEVTIPASDPAFARILHQFRRGRLARISILDAGVMKMDETVSLSGFTKAARGL